MTAVSTGVSTAQPVVELAGVSKRYASPGGGLHAVTELDLAVAAGEVIAIVGPSGCGKTTVLRIIQGLETPTGGHVRVGGGQGSAAGPAAEVGFVFQQPSLFPWWTVRQNVAFGLRLAVRSGRFSPAERDSRVSEMLTLAGLEQFADYSPRQLSGGMQQRANVARALAIEPRVLLLDEPFSAVDALNRERLQVTLSALLSQLGTTAIMVTHDIREAVFLGSRVVVMSARPGRVTDTFDVNVPRPRTTEFQRSTELAAIAQQVYGSLAETEKVLPDYAHHTPIPAGQARVRRPGRCCRGRRSGSRPDRVRIRPRRVRRRVRPRQSHA
jgi:ABC-type nitrate/sulfonate/bicarbonate transport system ATPase subunit